MIAKATRQPAGPLRYARIMPTKRQPPGRSGGRGGQFAQSAPRPADPQANIHLDGKASPTVAVKVGGSARVRVPKKTWDDYADAHIRLLMGGAETDGALDSDEMSPPSADGAERTADPHGWCEQCNGHDVDNCDDPTGLHQRINDRHTAETAFVGAVWQRRAKR